jgi:hypothetical protein
MLARAKSLGQLSFTSTSEGVPGVGVIAIVVDGQKVPVGAGPADTRVDELGLASGVPEAGVVDDRDPGHHEIRCATMKRSVGLLVAGCVSRATPTSP